MTPLSVVLMLVAGSIGAIVIVGEYATRMIRTTFAPSPTGARY